jgi:hypothetical protein
MELYSPHIYASFQSRLRVAKCPDLDYLELQILVVCAQLQIGVLASAAHQPTDTPTDAPYMQLPPEHVFVYRFIFQLLGGVRAV